MGKGLATYICPVPDGYNRFDADVVEAVIRRRACNVPAELWDGIEMVTGNDDPSTYEEAIVAAWKAVMEDVNPEDVGNAYVDVIEVSLDGQEVWFTAGITSGDAPCDGADHLVLLRVSGVCDRPIWHDLLADMMSDAVAYRTNDGDCADCDRIVCDDHHNDDRCHHRPAGQGRLPAAARRAPPRRGRSDVQGRGAQRRRRVRDGQRRGTRPGSRVHRHSPRAVRNRRAWLVRAEALNPEHPHRTGEPPPCPM